MRQLPKCIPELDGGLFLPRPVVELFEATLTEHERLLREQAAGQAEADLQALAELRQLARLAGLRPALPRPAELLGLEDPREQRVRRNLLRG